MKYLLSSIFLAFIIIGCAHTGEYYRQSCVRNCYDNFIIEKQKCNDLFDRSKLDKMEYYDCFQKAEENDSDCATLCWTCPCV